MRLDIHIFWTEKLWKEMSVTLCLLYSLTYVIFRAFWRRARPSQTSYPSVSRFSKWRRVGHAWRSLWNSPHSYLWWVGRLENQVFQIRKMERKERKITPYSCYYFDFLSSSPISIFFFIPIWTLREARNGHISSLQFDGQFNRLGWERLRGILGIGKIPNWGWYIFSDLREVGPGTCFFFYRIVF